MFHRFNASMLAPALSAAMLESNRSVRARLAANKKTQPLISVIAHDGSAVCRAVDAVVLRLAPLWPCAALKPAAVLRTTREFRAIMFLLDRSRARAGCAQPWLFSADPASPATPRERDETRATHLSLADAPLGSGFTDLNILIAACCAGRVSATKLAVQRAHIGAVPPLGDAFAALTELDLSQNRLVSIHDDAFRCSPLLATINLSQNQLAAFPAALFKPLAALRHLDLHQNHLAMPEICLDALCFVDLSDNHFGTVVRVRANRLATMPSTTTPTLNLHFNVLLDSVYVVLEAPASSAEAPPSPSALAVKVDHRCRVEASPSVSVQKQTPIAAMLAVVHKNVCGSSVLDDHVVSDSRSAIALRAAGALVDVMHSLFNAEWLRFVEVRSNRALGDTFVVGALELPALEELRLIDCNLCVVSGLARLTKLVVLDLSDNRIASLSAHDVMSRTVRDLTLDGNALTSLDWDWLPRGSLVRSLSLARNRIASVQPLPPIAADVVILRDNLIRALPRAMFSQCTTLCRIDLSGNLLGSDPMGDGAGVPVNVFVPCRGSLVALDLSRNFLQHVSFAVSSLPKLRWLDLSWNHLSSYKAVSLQALVYNAQLGIDITGNWFGAEHDTAATATAATAATAAAASTTAATAAAAAASDDNDSVDDDDDIDDKPLPQHQTNAATATLTLSATAPIAGARGGVMTLITGLQLNVVSGKWWCAERDSVQVIGEHGVKVELSPSALCVPHGEHSEAALRHYAPLFAADDVSLCASVLSNDDMPFDSSMPLPTDTHIVKLYDGRADPKANAVGIRCDQRSGRVRVYSKTSGSVSSVNHGQFGVRFLLRTAAAVGQASPFFWAAETTLKPPRTLIDEIGDEFQCLGTSLTDYINTLWGHATFGGRDDRLPHAFFVGNPGTGKTDVARKLAVELHKLGLLSRPTVKEVTRADLVSAQAGGETSLMVQRAVTAALGGILFVDEAYNLILRANDSQGSEAIAELIKQMEDKGGSFLAIFAGYELEMDGLLRANPGFASRIAYTVRFNDYSAKELMEIGVRMLGKTHIDANDAVRQRVRALIDARMGDAEFGNARGVRLLIQRAKDRCRVRCLSRDVGGRAAAAAATTSRLQFTPDDFVGAPAQPDSERMLAPLLASYGLAKYADRLRRNGIDVVALARLDLEGVRALGISSVGDGIRLLAIPTHVRVRWYTAGREHTASEHVSIRVATRPASAAQLVTQLHDALQLDSKQNGHATWLHVRTGELIKHGDDGARFAALWQQVRTGDVFEPQACVAKLIVVEHKSVGNDSSRVIEVNGFTAQRIAGFKHNNVPITHETAGQYALKIANNDTLEK